MDVDEKVKEAFRLFDRVNFVPDEMMELAHLDRALPIGYGQTISQPSTVKQMLKWLNPQTGNKILDIGSGSGWTVALLSHIVGPTGKIYAVEIVPELVEFGKNNCKNQKVANADFFEAGKEFGLPQHAPFDRILVSASAKEIPDALLEQLKPDGKLVAPVKNVIVELHKDSKGEYVEKRHPGYVFVPLIAKN